MKLFKTTNTETVEFDYSCATVCFPVFLFFYAVITVGEALNVILVHSL